MISPEETRLHTGPRIVVTGASGFLGGHVTAHFVGKGLSVAPVSRRRLPGIQLVRQYGETPPGDLVIHLAEDADRARVNELGQHGVEESVAVVTTLVKRFAGRVVYASSAAVYGDQHELPCTVDTLVVCNDFYSQSKTQAERTVLEAGGAVVRLSNLLGSGMSANNVVSEVLRQIPGFGPVYVRDDKPVRDFLAVTDAVEALRLLVENWHCGVLNVGSGIGTSVRALVQMCLRAAGEHQRVVVPTAPSSRSSTLVLDVSQTVRLLGWSPSLSLAQQLADLVFGTRT